MTSTVYLILEPNAVIASDLALNVQDFDPGAVVLVGTSAPDAIDLLAECSSVRLAFIHMDPDRFAATDLAALLADVGATLVFLGDAAEQSKGGMLVLQRPFTMQTTAALLEIATMSKVA